MKLNKKCLRKRVKRDGKVIILINNNINIKIRILLSVLFFCIPATFDSSTPN